MSEEIKDAAIELFNGNVRAAEIWLNKPSIKFNGLSPNEFLEYGKNEDIVLNYIKALEHGVFQ